MAPVSAVESLGGTFVQSVRDRVPADGPAILAELQALQGQLQPDVQGALAAFVRRELAGSPDTAWMAELVGAAPTTQSGRQVLSNIRTMNAELHDASITKGKRVAFFDSRGRVPLSDVLERVADGTKLSARLYRYEKLTGGLRAVRYLLDHEELEGVPLRARHTSHHPIQDVADLERLWTKIELTENL
ncbi:MAG: hypothetical protein RMA76_09780 [Deltaproteobacteria bacterium]|jgi:hypothetical protein